MTKNVTVTDTQGNIIGTTYPKRASGLVKNGRALFVDDCTIRLSEKTEPSDTYNTSEVNQMNYIFFNPRNWSFEQTQYNNQNSFVFSRTYTARNGTGYAQPVRAERSFINDFDGGLVESLMFGHWDAPAVNAVSNEMSLTPNTEYRFVFWLNGGENDKSSEICQLRIIFSGNREDCYIYNLNRNYIKPLLHKDGWELYSIPFLTPAVSSAMQGTSDSTPTVATRLAFVGGNAPMAVKPAKEPEFYADWEDVPDEFASQRPQRHNLVFEDGWPSISQYGGGNYSTEALRAKKEAEAKQANRFSNAYHSAAENLGNTTRNAAENIGHATKTAARSLRDAAQNMAQSARHMAENYKNSGSVNWRAADDTATTQSASTLSDDLLEHLDDIEMQRDDLSDRTDELRARFTELTGRVETMTAQGLLKPDVLDGLTGRLSAFESELHCLENRVNELDNQVDGADLEIEMRGMSSDEGDTYLDSLESLLDAEDCHSDGIEESLDSLEDYLDNLENAANNEE